MLYRILISTAIFLFVCVPCILLSVPVVACLLRTDWDGRTTIFGNAKWGRANNHPINPTQGYWQEFKWLVWRNPVNNLFCKILAIRNDDDVYTISGDPDIDNDSRAGFYVARQRWAWEYYWIKPYGDRTRCLRARIGWKIHLGDDPAAFVFAINPWKKYSGV